MEQAPLDNAAASGEVSDIVVALLDWSIATSGDYRRYFKSDKNDEARYSHTIDPRSGMPIQHHLSSVTVLHRECMLADVWSTALGVMGAEQGLAYANTHQLCALFIHRVNNGFAETMSNAMKDLLQ